MLVVDVREKGVVGEVLFQFIGVFVILCLYDVVGNDWYIHPTVCRGVCGD